MKLIKSKSNLKPINQEFLNETLNGSITLFGLLSEYADKKLNKDKLEEVILSEHKCDRLKERYIETLFKEKRALPFLVEDRYNIILNVDKINDLTETIARFMKILPFELYIDLTDDFKKFSKSGLEIVTILIDCVNKIEIDFTAAYKRTFEAEEIRRTARELNFKIIGSLYEKEDSAVRVYSLIRLILYMYKLITTAEEVSDYLRGLIIKYPTR